ncbi:hypothetical protein [Rhizobium tubonense]|uniref:hypothetical protein n=1 Tax=Rhizobium tubonense TaxID=484088 RepID=UPI001FCF125B|nr:hypothetical protein [Rhizobium tubonense]
MFILAVEESGKFITDKVPRNLALVTPTDPDRKSTDMKFWPKKASEAMKTTTIALASEI